MTPRISKLFLCLALTLLALPAVGQQSPETTEKPEAQGFSAAEEELLRAADDIAIEVARIRGLEVKGPIDKGIKRRDELRAVLISKLAEQVSDAEVAAEGDVFARLGLIPEDLDYKQMLLDVLTEQIAGFYDQATKELYIMQGIPLVLQRPAMAHELFHAIQDQHFDILDLQGPFTSTENGDFAMARAALIEGDATVVMFDFSLYEAGQLPQPGKTSVVDIPMAAGVLKQLSFDDLGAIEQMMGGSEMGMTTESVEDSALARAPRIFRELLMFPYFAGMRFIVSMRTQRTWEDVNEIYLDPPVSTEQIMHPQKYVDQDVPIFIDYAPGSKLKTWEKIYDTVMGEFQMYLYLRHHLEGLDDFSASDAAEGWDGDRLMAWRKDGDIMLAHMSAWDSDSDALEFFEATVRTLEKRFPDADREAMSGRFGQSECFLNDGERLYVERWGDLVLVVEGAPSELDEEGHETNPTLYHIREEAFSTLKRVPYSEHIKNAQLLKDREK